MKEQIKQFFNFKPFNRDNMLKLVCFVSVSAFLLVCLVSLIVGLTTTTPINLAGGNLFSDYAETLSYCIVQNPYADYGVHSIYPPFAFLIFYPFALICKGSLQEFLNIQQNVSWEAACSFAKTQPMIVFSFVLYYIINIALILLVVAKMSKLKGLNLVYLLLTIFCFGPFIYCFGRGNVLITAALFGLLFFWLYNSDKRWQREIANLCLACAIAIKIYPAVLLLFFLKDRRFWDLLKTLLYAVVLLFLPFLLIQGGFNNISAIWHNFTHFNGGESRDMDWSNIGLDGLASKIAALFSLIFGGANFGWMHSILSKIGRFGLVGFAIVLPFFSKKSELKMQVMLLPILAYILFQGVSYGYTMLFLLAPIIYFILNFDEFSNKDKIFYGTLYAIIAFQFFYFVNFFLIQAIALAVLAVKVIVDLIKDDIRINKEAKQLASANGVPVTENSNTENETLEVNNVEVELKESEPVKTEPKKRSTKSATKVENKTENKTTSKQTKKSNKKE